MIAFEQFHPTFKLTDYRGYASRTIDQQRLGNLIDLIGKIGLGKKTDETREALDFAWVCFLTKSLEAEGRILRSKSTI